MLKNVPCLLVLQSCMFLLLINEPSLLRIIFQNFIDVTANALFLANQFLPKLSFENL